MTFQRLKFNRLKVWLTAIAVSLSFLAQSQEAHWSEKLSEPDLNLYEVQSEFDTFWADQEIARGQGYKQYKRWEAFWEPRLFPSGNMVAPDQVYREVQRNRASETRLAQSGVWTYFGNTDVPSNAGGVGRVNMLRTDPNNLSHYYACAPAGGLWRSTNSGSSWSVMNTDDLGSIGVSDVAIDHTNPGTIYLATGDGDAGDTYALGVLKSTDDGLTWNTTGLSWTVQQIRRCNRIIMHPTDANILYVATSNGVYRTDDAGASWTQVIGGNIKDVQFKSGDPSRVYCVGNGDDFFYSPNNGLTWFQSVTGLPTSGISRMALTVSESEPNTLYILAGRSSDQGFEGYYRSQDSGLTWTQMSSAATINLLGWDVAGGDSGGQAWYDLTTACDPTDENTVYVGGVNTWKSSDGGATWSIVGHWYGASGNPYVHADVHGMHFIPGTSNLLVACDGGVFRTINGGASFTDLSNNLEIAQIYRLGVNQQDDQEVLTGWQDNGTNLGSSGVWSRPIGGDGFESIIDHTDPNIMYGTIYYGRIYKSFNGGANFSTVLNSGGTNGTPSESGAWLTPYVMSKNDHNKMFVAKDALHVSADGASSWTSYTVPGGTANALAVAQSNENYIFVGKGGTLYRSTNGGTTFTTLSGLSGSSITYIAIDPTDHNRMWVTFSGFGSGAKVYASTDAGDSWSNYSTGLPNIPCNTIVYQAGTSDGLYVGTDAGVYYRDAGFSSWQPYNDGLPNVVISELEIQEASGLLIAATYGRGVWKAPLFAIPSDDAAVISIDAPTGTACVPDVDPQFTVGNFGSNTLTSMTIEYGLNGVLTDSYNWTGSLATGASEQITLATVAAPIGMNSFIAQITVVNGVAGDDNPTNDSKSGNYEIATGEIEATVSILTDCWGSESSWELRDAGDVVIASAGPLPSSSTINTTVCLTDACYTFEMFDSYGDGLSSSGCADGDYNVTQVVDGSVLVTMAVANFGFSAAHPFCSVPLSIDGCTNNTACNYDATATNDDGSCILPDGCTDNTACNYNAAALCDDGSCILPDGCTDNTACNYNAAALCDNGTCILPDGCTDNTACNYNAAALCDDGSCILPDGCTNPSACNYDAAATCDDGSCDLGPCVCYGDLNGDGFIGVGDILIIIGNYQCVGPSCVGDINASNVTDTSDLLELLAIFGNACP